MGVFKAENMIHAGLMVDHPYSLCGQIGSSAESDYNIDTALYHIVFTNRGGVVKSWVLKKFQDDSGKPLQLVNSYANDVPLPFAIDAKNANDETFHVSMAHPSQNKSFNVGLRQLRPDIIASLS